MLNRCLCLAFLVLVCGIWALFQNTASAGSDDERIAQLIKQLGSNKYADREKARRDLEVIGVPALEQLRLATTDADLEISRRCQELVKKLEDKLAVDALLAPKKIKLSFKEIAVKKAIEDIQKQSGYQITFEGDPAAFYKRTVSLETGEVTFWEAFDQLCQAAGLREVRSDLSFLYRQTIQMRPIQVPVKVQPQPVPPPVRQPAINLRAPFQPAAVMQPGVLVLREGALQPIPTSIRGAVRVRLLPAGQATEISVQPALRHEALLVLDVNAEPRLEQFSVVGAARLDKAIDDQGQELTMVAERLASQQLDMAVHFSFGPVSQPRQVALRLKLGEKPATSLKELAGSVTIQGQHPTPEALITMDDVMHATGKTATGQAGGSLEVLKIAKQANDVYGVQIRFQGPQQGMPANGQFVIVQGGNGAAVQVIQGPLTLNASSGQNLPVLVDANGKKLNLEQLPQTVSRLVNGQFSQDINMVFRSGAGIGEPTKMILFGHRMVTATVPFRFEDVPLP